MSTVQSVAGKRHLGVKPHGAQITLPIRPPCRKMGDLQHTGLKELLIQSMPYMDTVPHSVPLQHPVVTWDILVAEEELSLNRDGTYPRMAQPQSESNSGDTA